MDSSDDSRVSFTLLQILIVIFFFNCSLIELQVNGSELKDKSEPKLNIAKCSVYVRLKTKNWRILFAM